MPVFIGGKGMNKQELIAYYEKSIKKLEALQEEYQTQGELCRLIGKTEGIKIALQKTKELEESSDPIPLPTIKPGDRQYKCPTCSEVSNVNDWNSKTMLSYGENVYLLGTEEDEDCTYFCPKCGNEQYGVSYLEVVE